jgi:predicted Rossmann-fold nucleotide-binding protein
MTATEKTATLPAQHQNHQPGVQSKMQPQARSDRAEHRGSDKLKNRAVLITGGDSGIGRAVAIGAAKEGARVAIVYLEEENDAKETRRRRRERVPAGRQ